MKMLGQKFNLADEDLKHLSAVISEVEKSTRGELRLVVVRGSSVVGHVFPLLTLLLLFLLVEAVSLMNSVSWVSWSWLAYLSIPMVALSFYLSRVNCVQRWLTSSYDMDAQVLRRAELEFLQMEMFLTEERSGILLFLSLKEREMVVLADKGISATMPKEIWSDVIELALAKGKPSRDSLEAAIRSCGKILAEKFPIRPGDKNELSNHVVFKD